MGDYENLIIPGMFRKNLMSKFLYFCTTLAEVLLNCFSTGHTTWLDHKSTDLPQGGRDCERRAWMKMSYSKACVICPR